MSDATEPERAVIIDGDGSCRACGADPAPAWDTADGRVHLCPSCAVLHGIGCG
jgi:hypothetical protein